MPLIAVELLGTGLALIAAVGAGTIAHELSHVIPLRAFGVSYDLEWLPKNEATGPLRASIAGGLASVQLRGIPGGLAPWKLRVAAFMPFLLSTPFALALVGLVPDPFQAGNSPLSAAFIGWLACAIPSPKDFSMFWYAERIVGRSGDERSTLFDDETTP